MRKSTHANSKTTHKEGSVSSTRARASCLRIEVPRAWDWGSERELWVIACGSLHVSLAIRTTDNGLDHVPWPLDGFFYRPRRSKLHTLLCCYRQRAKPASWLWRLTQHAMQEKGTRAIVPRNHWRRRSAPMQYPEPPHASDLRIRNS